jgi:hypothetical protein
MRESFRAGLAGLLLLATLPAQARADAALCDDAARHAAQETGVPPALLHAILLAESGRDRGQGRQGWPWTLHAGGQGFWLATAEDATAQLSALIAEGRSNIDIGCFQINLHWHGRAFPDAAAMLDPVENARYAARFLLDLHDQTGDWRSAAGAYHSRDATRAEAYVNRLIALHEAGSGPAPEPPPVPVARGKGFGQGGGGPLIRLGALDGPLIGGLR